MSLAAHPRLRHYAAVNPAVYIMTNCGRTVLYIGVTSCLEKRVAQHECGKGSVFTRRYRIDRLVYFETFQTMRDAIDRETAIKQKSRAGKIRMIEAMNPGWVDLARV